MTYNPNIPQGTDNLSTSQGQMLTNFGLLNTYFGRDHFAFTDGTNPGYHQQVNLTFSNPSVAVTNGGVFYGKAAVTSGSCTPAWKTKISSTTFGYTMPVCLNAGNFTTSSSSTKTLNNFSGYPPMMGTAYAFDTANFRRTLISPFYWDGTTVYFPGSTGQLPSGSTLVKFDSSTSSAQLITDGTSGLVVNIRYIGDLLS
jgi:hypothetical protein